MKKLSILVLVLLFASVAHSQTEKALILNEETNLIEATYYYDNGVVSQEGTFNLEGKLHGAWVSYSDSGEKISEGSYTNGAKTGKWFFWADGMVKEVEFNNNSIASVINKESASGITKN